MRSRRHPLHGLHYAGTASVGPPALRGCSVRVQRPKRASAYIGSSAPSSTVPRWRQATVHRQPVLRSRVGLRGAKLLSALMIDPLSFGSPADPEGPVALRPHLAMGLPLFADVIRMNPGQPLVQGRRCPVWWRWGVLKAYVPWDFTRWMRGNSGPTPDPVAPVRRHGRLVHRGPVGRARRRAARAPRELTQRLRSAAGPTCSPATSPTGLAPASRCATPTSPSGAGCSARSCTTRCRRPSRWRRTWSASWAAATTCCGPARDPDALAALLEEAVVASERPAPTCCWPPAWTPGTAPLVRRTRAGPECSTRTSGRSRGGTARTCSTCGGCGRCATGGCGRRTGST